MKDIILLIANIILGAISLLSMAYCFFASFALSTKSFIYDYEPTKEEMKECFISFFICLSGLIGMIVMNSVFHNWV